MSYSAVWQNERPLSRPSADGPEIVVTPPTDRHLVEAVLAGDETAFEQIFDRYKKLAVSVVSRYFRRPEEVEELVQTVFAKVYFELPKFRGENDLSLASWISRIASNSCIDILRKQKHRPDHTGSDTPDIEDLILTMPDPSDMDSERRLIERDLADKLLSTIDPSDRAILQMLHVEGMSIEEAARALGWSSSRLKMRAWRAKHALRKVVKRLL